MSRDRQERLAQYGDWSVSRMCRVYDSIVAWNARTREAIANGCSFAAGAYARVVYRRASRLYVEL